MSAAEIAAALGGAYRSGLWWRCRCPVHASLGASLALLDGSNGLVAHCHRGCRRADVFAELGRRGLLATCHDLLATCHDLSRPVNAERDPETARRRQQSEAAETRRRIAAALDIWGTSYNYRGNLAERYLRSRGITIDLPPTIRAHGLMRHRESGEVRPAMVALVEHLEHGPCAVHVTYLNPIDPSVIVTIEPRKRMIGPVGGGAVRLAPAAETLVVAEGVETAASCMQATAMPAWAALSTSGLQTLLLPPMVRTVIIAGDNDASGAGQHAARTAGYRWLAEGRRVRIAIPPMPGADFNDVLMGRASMRTEESIYV